MLKRPRGTEDVLPPESAHWQHVEARARDVAQRFGFREIRTPVFEHTELFRRGTGETTDIVEKEMYTFADRGGRSLTLRPESTAPVARALLEAGLVPGRQKVYYLQSHFRYERPQAGRSRQHSQFGVEYFGEASPLADAEVILLARRFLTELGVADLEVRLNSIGCADCRPAYRAALVAFFAPKVERLCPDCRRRLDQNPLRLLDCKVDSCRREREGHPVATDYLCPACRDHFDGLRRALAAVGFAYALDPTLVRGIDYYTRTVFEITSGAAGEAATVCGGGRYDGLVEAIGGPPTPGVGFGLGLERLLLMLAARGRLPDPPPAAEVALVPVGEGVETVALRLAEEIRAAGFSLDLLVGEKSLKAQMRQADRLGVRLVLLLGPDEAKEGVATLRRLADGHQERVPLAAIASRLATEVKAP